MTNTKEHKLFRNSEIIDQNTTVICLKNMQVGKAIRLWANLFESITEFKTWHSIRKSFKIWHPDPHVTDS
jgi:hypothetical protein